MNYRKIRTGINSVRLDKQWQTTVRLDSKKHTLRTLIIITNYKCNLHCKDCTMFIPYVKKEKQTFFDVERLISDLEILRNAANFRWVQIQGGEPVLFKAKDLERLIAYLIDNDLIPRYLMPNKILPKIRVATNAMLLLTKQQLNLFSKYAVEVRMSDYGVKNQKIDQIVEQCRAHKIPYRVHRQITKNKSWLDMGGSYNGDDDEVKKIFDTCIKNDCYTLIDGKLTRCTRSIMGSVIGLYPDFSGDYVDLRNTEDIHGDLRSFLLDKRFMDACRYCNGSTGREIPAGIQLDKSARKNPLFVEHTTD